MSEVTYVHPDGSKQVIEVPAGTSIMQGALLNGVLGIVAECGGQLVCATCHVYVQQAKGGQLTPMAEYEEEMLECTASPRKDNSRLSCQIVMTDDLGDLTVELPEAQN